MENKRPNLFLDKNKIAPPRIELSFLQIETGQLQLLNGQSYEFTANDLIDEKCIGIGGFGGIVNKMKHKQSGEMIAVKRIRAFEVEQRKRERLLIEHKIIIQSQNCNDIIRYFGAIFHEGDCWICMELMDCSLDKLYPSIYNSGEHLPERFIGFIIASVLRALNYLNEKLNIIHRDVKPSNILLDKKGFVRLCDFGISGYLVDSIAKSMDVGCVAYMSPERLLNDEPYDIRSDVWSLGIMLVEICTGQSPFHKCENVFQQSYFIIYEDPPFLNVSERHSFELVNFTNQCLTKEVEKRPKFKKLMEHNFFKTYNMLDSSKLENERNVFGEFVQKWLNRSPNIEAN